MFAEINGIKMYYEESGQGRPLIMVHGNSEDHTIFEEASAVLSRSYHVFLVDSRGHGQSSAVEVFHYADMAEDMIAFLEAQDLRDAVFYGFSDGGIIGLLAAMKTDRITDLIVSGANVSPDGVKSSLKAVIRLLYAFTRDPKMKLMLEEPHITADMLKTVRARTLVLAGAKDAVKENETRIIAENIPGAELKIIDGEDHGSYIVHSRKIGDLLAGWLSHKR